VPGPHDEVRKAHGIALCSESSQSCWPILHLLRQSEPLDSALLCCTPPCYTLTRFRKTQAWGHKSGRGGTNTSAHHRCGTSRLADTCTPNEMQSLKSAASHWLKSIITLRPMFGLLRVHARYVIFQVNEHGTANSAQTSAARWRSMHMTQDLKGGVLLRTTYYECNQHVQYFQR
jgi:hypothetical protein